MEATKTPTREQKCARMQDWQSRLERLLSEIEIAHGEDQTKLEHLVRFAWEEAYAEKKRLSEPAPTPIEAG